MNGKSTAHRIVWMQLAATIVVAAILFAASGTAAAAAAAAGGGIAVVNNLYFARLLFAGGIVPAKTVLHRFYLAEVVKIVLTTALFLAALLVFRLSFLPLLSGYGVALTIHWFALLLPPAAVQR